MGKAVSKLLQKLAPRRCDKFPFAELPAVCKIRVFSCLNIDDRVSAAHVCTEWRHLLSSPALWTDVDVPASVRSVLSVQRADRHRDGAHHVRVKKFLDFIATVDPCIRRFVFVGDIAETVYHDSLQLFLAHARLSELQHVSINWSKTAVDGADNMTLHEDSACLWSIDENHRRRQRYFVHLFERLCLAAPNIKSLNVPFDWSSKSISAMLQLCKIENLLLSKYSELQALDPVTLERVISGMPQLRWLRLEVWTACASGGLTYYSLCSKSLELVDLSRCRGFALGYVDLPKAQILKLSRCPWSGPLKVQKTMDIYSLPCLHQILRDGAPNLVELNGQKLEENWREHVDVELELLLKSVCPCELHYDWASVISDCVWDN